MSRLGSGREPMPWHANARQPQSLSELEGPKTVEPLQNLHKSLLPQRSSSQVVELLAALLNHGK
jgi:hypothetical protein